MAVVDYAVVGHIATITLNRPEARNAVSPEVAVRLAEAWSAVRDDDNVRVGRHTDDLLELNADPRHRFID